MIRLSQALILLFLGTAQLIAQRPIVLAGGTMIDGVGKKPVSDVNIIINRGVIIAVGEKDFVIIPPDAEIIDVRGKFIIPGLIDAHTHYDSPRDLRQLFAWGVTSVNCMFESTDQAKEMERLTASDTNRTPRIYATAPIFSTEHGWWWGEGFPKDTAINRFPQSPEEAREQIRKVMAKGITRIKLMYDSMDWCRDSLAPLAQMKPDIMRALIDEAMQQHIMTEVHAPKFRDAEEAQEAGASAFMHGIIDERLDAPFVANVQTKLEFYIPTFCLYEFLADVDGFVNHVLADKRFRSALPDQVITEYTRPDYGKRYRERYPNSVYIKNHLHILRENMMAIINNYGVVGMGTDMWAFPGIAAHLEMEYMVKAGLTPIQAIAVATTLSGQFLGTESGVGRILPGFRADLLILNADPTADIRNTRSIGTVIRAGKMYDHAALVKRAKE